MGKMKQIAMLTSHGDQMTQAYIAQFKSAIRRAKAKNINYVVVQGDFWTVEQAEGVISLLAQTLTQDDTLHRESSTTPDS